MTAKEQRQYEMLLRVQEFGTIHRSLFPESTDAHDVFAEVDGIIDELSAASTRKKAAGTIKRGDRNRAARRALTDLLVKYNLLGKVLSARGGGAPVFELPASRSDQSLLTTAREFALAAGPLEADVTAHGIPLRALPDAIAAFEAALRDRSNGRADYRAERTRIQELLARVVTPLQRLDLIVGSACAGDPVLEDRWHQARQVGNTRRLKTADASEPQAAEPMESVTAVPVAPAA